MEKSTLEPGLTVTKMLLFHCPLISMINTDTYVEKEQKVIRHGVSEGLSQVSICLRLRS